MHFGEVIDIRTVPGGDSTEADLQQASSEFWQTEYPGEPYHLILPFEDGLSDEFQKVLEIQCAKLRPLSPPMLSYDLVAAADRQRHFFYQVRVRHIPPFSSMILDIFYSHSLCPHDRLSNGQKDLDTASFRLSVP